MLRADQSARRLGRGVDSRLSASCAGASIDGKRVLGLKLTWDKRYITLGPVATLLGLAFRAYDPEHLVGDKRGPRHHLRAGSRRRIRACSIGRRHMPLNAVFQNGPNWGSDVFIPMDWVIGGQPMLGRGWRMLMECLAAGRGISLPAIGTGMAKLAVRTTGGYARVRQQFKLPIGAFEGIEEPLARMGGNLYMMDATRQLTARAVDLGEKPAVLSGIAKLHLTERGARSINDAMDIVGGKGICMGPSNFLGAAYMQLPVAITVEGANILTRSLIVFGQGAIRCHPFVLKEIAGHAARRRARGASSRSTRALFGHLRFALSNLARSLVMGLTGLALRPRPGDVAPGTQRYYQQLTRFSAALAFLADVSMGVLGGALKRKEKLSARLGDILSLLYLCSATLKRYEDEGRQGRRRAADALGDLGCDVQGAERVRRRHLELPESLPRRSDVARSCSRWAVRTKCRRTTLGHEVAQLLITPSRSARPAHRRHVHPGAARSRCAQIELALEAMIAAEPVEAKIKAAALRAGKLRRASSGRARTSTRSRRAPSRRASSPQRKRTRCSPRAS